MEREKSRLIPGMPSPRDESAIHRAALEASWSTKHALPKVGQALFAPKTPPAATPMLPEPASAPRAQVKMVTMRARVLDPDRAFHDKLLAKFLAAEGTAAVTRAAADCAQAGFTLPEDQSVCLKMLDHPDEARVRDALSSLMRMITEAAGPPRRRTVLDARLRRLEDDAEELATREQATALRRKIPRNVC